MPAWQPISTAPKDGTEVLLFGPKYDGGTYQDVCGFYHRRWPVVWMEGFGEPSHWMPLPEPPTSEEQEK